MSENLEHIRHDYLRYANCWEDADLLVQALQIKEGDRVLSIASGGDNSFSLLTGNPEIVVAADLNPVQIKCVELKKVAIQELDHTSFLEFMGFRPSKNRIEVYRGFASKLSPEAKAFWDYRMDSISKGLIHSGKFERYFGIFRKYVLPFIHSKVDLANLLSAKSKEDQANYYHQHWNNRRWRLLFKLFFSRTVMGRLGRDPEFLNNVTINVGDFIFDRAEAHLSSADCQSNPYLEFIFTGQFERTLPHYARAENYEIIRSNIDRLIIFEGPVQAAAEYGPFDAFNLSNIFEYLNLKTFEKVGNHLFDLASPKARFAYWNLMVVRDLQKLHKELHDSSAAEDATDNGFFYRKFHIQQLS